MAKSFSIVAQLQLQGPKNLNAVVKDIQTGLKNINAQVNVETSKKAANDLKNTADSMDKVKKSASSTNKVIKDTEKQFNQAGSAAFNFGKQSALAVKRFAAFSVSAGALAGVISALKSGVSEAISFERQLVRVAQVTGKTMGQLKGLERQITSISSGLGVSSADLIDVSRTLAQTGLAAQDVTKALKALAQASLAPTFNDIQNATEGAISIMRQFGVTADELAGKLGSINAVAGQFAVESEDIIFAIRRTGGAFKAAGGSLEELIALFTSVRATTRESAETIATGFRTIFTRIQRPKTIGFLKELGIELQDLNGQFVGPFEAVKRLNQGLKGLATTDPRFAQIVEELGGFRQVSKVIPLIQQFTTAQNALKAAQKGSGSLAKDAATAQQSLAVQIVKLREEFLGLARDIVGSDSFQFAAKAALSFASSIIKVVGALKPLLPLLATLATFKAIQLGVQFAGGLASGFGAGGGAAGLGQRLGGGRRFASGGVVPGSGGGDTVPAMLTPGEFVVRKSAVKKYGASNLARLNSVQKFQKGGSVNFKPGKNISAFVLEGNAGSYTSASDTPFGLTGSFAKQFGTDKGVVTKGLTASVFKPMDKAKGLGPALADSVRTSVGGAVKDGLAAAGKGIDLSALGISINPGKATSVINKAKGDKQFVNSALGFVQEGVIAGLTGIDTAGEQGNFDIPSISGEDAKNLSKIYGPGVPAGVGEFKVNRDKLKSAKSGLVKKFYSDVNKGGLLSQPIASTRLSPAQMKDMKKKAGKQRKRRASGGSIGGTDSVPSLLTPGEFVVNRSAAKNIGYTALNNINSGKVKKFANGGVVPGGGGGGGGGLDTLADDILADLKVDVDKLGEGTADFKSGAESLKKAAAEAEKISAQIREKNKKDGPARTGTKDQIAAGGGAGSASAKGKDDDFKLKVREKQQSKKVGDSKNVIDAGGGKEGMAARKKAKADIAAAKASREAAKSSRKAARANEEQGGAFARNLLIFQALPGVLGIVTNLFGEVPGPVKNAVEGLTVLAGSFASLQAVLGGVIQKFGRQADGSALSDKGFGQVMRQQTQASERAGFGKLSSKTRGLGKALTTTSAGATMLTAGFAAAGVALSAFGQKLKEEAIKDVESATTDEEFAAAESKAATGSMLDMAGTGAAGGAAIGAAIGSIIPGIGTAVGAVLGALIGGLGGLIWGFFSPDLTAIRKAIQKRKDELLLKRIAKSTEKLEKSFKPGQGFDDAALNDFSKNLSNLAGEIQGIRFDTNEKGDKAERAKRLSEGKGGTKDLQAATIKLASQLINQGMSNEEIMRQDDVTQGGLIVTPNEQFGKVLKMAEKAAAAQAEAALMAENPDASIKEVMDARKEAKKAAREQVQSMLRIKQAAIAAAEALDRQRDMLKVLTDFKQRVQELSTMFSDANVSVNNFQAAIDGTSMNATVGAGTGLSSGVISRGVRGEVVNEKQFSSALGTVDPTGGLFQQQAEDARRISKTLPDALMQAAKASRKEGGGDIATELGNILGGGILAEGIVKTLRKETTGDQQTDAGIVNNILEGGATEFAATLMDQQVITRVAEELEGVAQAIVTAQQELNGLLQSRLDMEMKLLDQRLKVQEKTNQLADIIATRGGEDPDAVSFQDVVDRDMNRQREILGRPGEAGSVGGGMFDSDLAGDPVGLGLKLSELQSQIESQITKIQGMGVGDDVFGAQQELANLQEQAKRTRMALEDIQNSGERLAAAQKKLEQERKKREFRSGLATDFAFAGREERRTMGIGMAAAGNFARFAAGEDGALSPQELVQMGPEGEAAAQGGRRFLEQLDAAGVSIGGQDAGEVLKETTRKQLQQDLAGQGFSAAEIDDLVDAMLEPSEPEVDALNTLITEAERQRDAAQALADVQKDATDKAGEAVTDAINKARTAQIQALAKVIDALGGDSNSLLADEQDRRRGEFDKKRRADAQKKVDREIRDEKKREKQEVDKIREKKRLGGELTEDEQTKLDRADIDRTQGTAMEEDTMERIMKRRRKQAFAAKEKDLGRKLTPEEKAAIEKEHGFTADKDGKVSFDSSNVSRAVNPNAPTISEMFDDDGLSKEDRKYDKDGDGKLSRDERVEKELDTSPNQNPFEKDIRKKPPPPKPIITPAASGGSISRLPGEGLGERGPNAPSRKEYRRLRIEHEKRLKRPLTGPEISSLTNTGTLDSADQYETSPNETSPKPDIGKPTQSDTGMFDTTGDTATVTPEQSSTPIEAVPSRSGTGSQSISEQGFTADGEGGEKTGTLQEALNNFMENETLSTSLNSFVEAFGGGKAIQHELTVQGSDVTVRFEGIEDLKEVFKEEVMSAVFEQINSDRGDEEGQPGTKKPVGSQGRAGRRGS